MIYDVQILKNWELLIRRSLTGLALVSQKFEWLEAMYIIMCFIMLQ